jgi:hypothetical protein
MRIYMNAGLMTYPAPHKTMCSVPDWTERTIAWERKVYITMSVFPPPDKHHHQNLARHGNYAAGPSQVDL